MTDLVVGILFWTGFSFLIATSMWMIFTVNKMKKENALMQLDLRLLGERLQVNKMMDDELK